MAKIITTRWEIIAVKGDRRMSLGFSARKTKRALWAAMPANPDRVCAYIGANIKATITSDTAQAIKFSDGAEVRWSGRTEGDFLRGQVA